MVVRLWRKFLQDYDRFLDWTNYQLKVEASINLDETRFSNCERLSRVLRTIIDFALTTPKTFHSQRILCYTKSVLYAYNLPKDLIRVIVEAMGYHKFITY